MVRTFLFGSAGRLRGPWQYRTGIFGAALLALFCGSCQSPAGEAALAAPASPSASATAPCLPSDIAGKVEELVYDASQPFDAEDYGDCTVGSAGSCGSPPRGQPLPPSLSGYASDLAGAYTIAPDHLKTALCALDRIYIVRNPNLLAKNPVAWGMRDLRNGGKTHIGLSEKLWTDPTINKPGTPVASYETFVLDALLNGAFTGSGSTFAASPDGDSRLKFLGILAHEMSHIFWYTNNIEGTRCPIGSPGGGMIYRNFHLLDPLYSWKQKVGTGLIRPGFHRFNDEQGNTNTYGTLVSLIAAAMARGEHSALPALYAFGHFASLFSLVAPDEDFAETYKLWAMKQAVPQLDLSITVPVDNHPRIVHVKQPQLKTRWIDLWTQHSCR